MLIVQLTIADKSITRKKLIVRKTLPFVGDEFVSGTDAVIIGGL